MIPHRRFVCHAEIDFWIKNLQNIRYDKLKEKSNDWIPWLSPKDDFVHQGKIEIDKRKGSFYQNPAAFSRLHNPIVSLTVCRKENGDSCSLFSCIS